MVTISNYLHGNFLNVEHSELEKPVCILTGPEGSRTLWEYSIQKNQNRHMVILDFGIRAIKRVDKHDEHGIARMDRHYVMFGRRHANLNDVVQALAKHIKTHPQECLLLIEGIDSLEIMYAMSDIVDFLNRLSSMPLKQVNIYAEGVQPQTLRTLERLSTCVINLSQEISNDSWKSTMVTRRYTGFSHEQEYLVELDKTLKVSRYKKEEEKEEEGVGNIGFSVKRDVKKEEMDKLKSIIYPHLRKQTEGCETCKQTKCACQQPEIVLDEEHEDDVDV